MKKVNFRFWQNPRFRYGSVSTLLVCLFFAVLVALNGVFTTLEKRNGWRVDYSFNALTTHSEATTRILDALPHPVHIYALFERNEEDLPLMELLDRYAAASPLVTWEQTSASLNPTLLTRFRGDTSDNAVTSNSLIVYCEATDRFRVLSPENFVSLTVDYETGSFTSANYTYESEITAAIDYVTRATIPVVYVIQGHDELDANTSAVLSSLLMNNHYDVRYAPLSSIELNAEDLVMFLAPVRDLTDSELTEITDFTAQGGSILFACDYSDPLVSMPNYTALLRSYGFLPLEGVVVASREEPDTYYEGNRTILLPDMYATDVTLDLLLNGANTLLMSTARAFEIPETTDNTLTVEPMLVSGEKSYLRGLSTTSTSLEKQEGDLTGPFALALQARRFSPSGDVSRAIMLGSTTLLTSDYFHAMTHSQEFIIRMMDYLLDSSASNLGIMARAAIRPQLSAESVTMGSIMLVALPLAVLAAALLILYPRRHL
ncbi:MAG: Gldg family protein [Clostridia bacterium]|nr:Gldg family protein [Clostridia bacterium]